MTKADQAERQKAIEQLREWIKPGDTVYTILDSVSRSGMSRQIRVVVPYIRHEVQIDGHWQEWKDTPGHCLCGEPLIVQADIWSCPTHGNGSTKWATRETVDFIHPNWSIAKALDYRRAKKGDGLIVGGCGMDMGYHLVYSLARVLFPDFTCIGEGCPSNDHVNGDRDYTVGKLHSDGGYSLKHRWL